MSLRALLLTPVAMSVMLGCSNENGAASQLTVSYEEADATCRAYCDPANPGPTCDEFSGSACYRICIGTYESRSVANCPPELKCDRRGYCIEETMWAYFGCAVDEDCNDTEGRCEVAMRDLEECEAQWEADTPAWCRENCRADCINDYGRRPAYGRSCRVGCEGDADCLPGSHCYLEAGFCISECQWRRSGYGELVPSPCTSGKTCDSRGCCVPRSEIPSRDQTSIYCSPP